MDGSIVEQVGAPVYDAVEAVVVDNTTGKVERLFYITVGDGATGSGFVGCASTVLIARSDGFTISYAKVSSETVIEKYSELVPCFASGTHILTNTGERPIEMFNTGDLIVTKDSGLQPVRRVGSTTVEANDRFAPVVITAGTVGNSTELRVSPKNRMLIEGLKVALNLGMSEAQIPVKHDHLCDHSRHKRFSARLA